MYSVSIRSHFYSIFIATITTTMRLLTVWPTIAILTYCLALPTMLQFRDVIENMLAEDDVYAKVLSERIILKKSQIPMYLRPLIMKTHEIIPLNALFELNRMFTKTHYSCKRLNLSAMILGTAVTCLAYKRIAFHLALTIRMIALLTDHKQLVVRSKVFAYALPFNADILMITEKNHECLWNLYEKVAHVASLDGRQVVTEEYIKDLNGQLITLVEFIESSCTIGSMEKYYESLELKSVNLNDIPDLIVDGRTLSDSLTLPQITILMKENENAMLDFPEKMNIIRNMNMATWKILLKIPDLPTDPDEFKRVTPPRYSETIMKIMKNDTPYRTIEVM